MRIPFPAALILTLGLLAGGCSREETPRETFVVDVMNGYTPVKNQGRDNACWAYAMLAAIETTHISQGDSVELSAPFAVRCLLQDRFRRHFLSGDAAPIAIRATAQTLLNVIGSHGIMPTYAFRRGDEASAEAAAKALRRVSQAMRASRRGLRAAEERAETILDSHFGPAPPAVHMLGAAYTPQEFARSVCAPGEYAALTSFTHHPFNSSFALETADNIDRDLFLNLPIDTLMARVERAVRAGKGVCWEGDTSEPGFSFSRGVARLRPGEASTQAARQKAFERHETTDDHCMAIVGIARDKAGGKYFVMKNSWGTDNPYGGLMYVAEDYVRKKTIAVFLP